MSIWSSTAGHNVKALNGNNEAAHYRAEGEPTIDIDVATTSFHNHIRLCVFDGDGLDVCALLSPDNARELRDALTEALDKT